MYVVEDANQNYRVHGAAEELIVSSDGQYKRATVKIAGMEINYGTPQPNDTSKAEVRAGGIFWQK